MLKINYLFYFIVFLLQSVNAGEINSEVFSFGSNSVREKKILSKKDGHLGDGTSINRFVPVKIDRKNIISVFSGDKTTFLLSNESSVYSIGNNTVKKN